MPKKRGTRAALRVAADAANPNPPAPAPLPQWVTGILDWIGRVGLVEELVSIQRHLELLLRATRARIDEVETSMSEARRVRRR